MPSLVRIKVATKAQTENTKRIRIGLSAIAFVETLGHARILLRYSMVERNHRPHSKYHRKIGITESPPLNF